MPKQFHVTGTCIPAKNYMVDISERVDKIVREYVEKGKYFTINRARQYGKTTTLYLLEEKMKTSYLVLSLSFEAADEYFVSPGNLANGLILDIGDCLKRQNVSQALLDAWNTPVGSEFPMRELGRKITSLCSCSEKEIVLMIDEVDKSSDNQIFLSFLGLLRAKYLDQQKGKDVTFKSVILAGVYDIKTLKLKLHPEEEPKYNSPWNIRESNEENESLLSFDECPRDQRGVSPFDIAADFNIDMSFSAKEICTMLTDYENDYHTEMDILNKSRSNLRLFEGAGWNCNDRKPDF